MNKEELYKYYKRKTKKEIIEELLYKCNANYYLKQRIDKAIEYIENNSLYDIEYDEDIYENETYTSGANDEIASRDLLDILKGSDSNESN